MEAVVTCTQEGQVWEASMKCDYTPEGESTVEVTAPETIAGVKAVITQEDWSLAYEDVCLNAGTLSEETVSPAVCLPRADGFYLMTPFNRVALMERLIARLKTELLDAEG